MSVVELLIARDADPAIEDGIYHSTAAGWAAHFGAARVTSYLNRVAARSKLAE